LFRLTKTTRREPFVIKPFIVFILAMLPGESETPGFGLVLEQITKQDFFYYSRLRILQVVVLDRRREEKKINQPICPRASASVDLRYQLITLGNVFIHRHLHWLS
jgi:hypothetical protein